MPILKPITGHSGCAPIRRYLEKDGRALALDLMNFAWQETGVIEPKDRMPEGFDWARAMDDTRHAFGHDRPFRGRAPRTFKHFIVSPSPEDKITLDGLRELAGTWLLRHFKDHEAVIVYHDDNARRIPHAHIVVNCTDLKTGRKLQTTNPKALNRSLQALAKERDLAYLERRSGAVISSVLAPEKTARTHQAVRIGRAEARIEREGGYSWLADVRSRVDVARHLAANQAEFKTILHILEVNMEDSKGKRHRPDWVYSLTNQPHRRVCGETLGAMYGKNEITAYFRRRGNMEDVSYRKSTLTQAKGIITLNDLEELHELASALSACDRYALHSVQGLDGKLERLRNMEANRTDVEAKQRLRKDIAELSRARECIIARNLLPEKAAPRKQPIPERTSGRKSPRGEVPYAPRRICEEQQTRQRSYEQQSRHNHDRSR